MTETFHVQTMKKCLEQKELVRAFISPKLIFFSFFDFPFPCVRVCLEQEGGGGGGWGVLVEIPVPNLRNVF